MVDTLTSLFYDQIKTALKLSKVPAVVTEDNVYQEGNLDILPLLDEMVERLSLPGSGVDGFENLEELLLKAESGKSCLLLVEHYSNLDLSIVSYLSRKAEGRGRDIHNALIAIAGMKLSEHNPGVAALASAYTRIVIYPSRSIQDLDPEKDKDEIHRAKAINIAAMKSLIRHKYKGKLVLVFPSGTRYRPWEPETKKGVREIDSYIRSFDYMCYVAINGQLMHVEQRDMLHDMMTKDIVRVTAGPVLSCSEFRDNILANTSAEEDKKQAVADAIMKELNIIHDAAEEKRLKLLN